MPRKANEIVQFDDSAASGVLLTCKLCPFWYGFAWTQAEADGRGATHEENVHPEHAVRLRKLRQVRARVARFREQHAEQQAM